MKLRIHHQELRFRLSAKDLDLLSSQKEIKEELQFSPTTKWTYSLKLSQSADQTGPELKATLPRIEMLLPEVQFQNWLQGPEIEWSYSQPEPELNILIEKDLK